jgi:very-short-patch-repair endonuclease
MLKYDKKLKEYSRKLRKNMTDAERLLWFKMRGNQLKGYQFYRQKPIGDYIVDFYCPKAELVIEIDGSQHYSSEGKQKDEIRDNYIKQVGLRVLRFSDIEVFKNLDEVIEVIWGNLPCPRKSPLTPLLQRGELKGGFYKRGRFFFTKRGLELLCTNVVKRCRINEIPLSPPFAKGLNPPLIPPFAKGLNPPQSPFCKGGYRGI